MHYKTGNISRAILLTAAIMTGIGTTAQSNGVRIDELDVTGERIHSYYPQNGTVSFYVHGQNGNWNVSTSHSNQIAKLHFVPYGTESYPLTIETESDGTPASEEVKVTVEIVDEKTSKPQKIAHKAGDGMSVKCGTRIHLHIDVPHGYWPAISILRKYTGVDHIHGDEHWATEHALTISSMANGNKAFSEKMMEDTEYRRWIEGHIKNGENSGFERDPSVPDRWTYEYVMDNEPISFKVFAETTDNQLLQAIASTAIRSLYMPYSELLFNCMASGEPYFMMAGGEFMSDDYVSGLANKVNEFDHIRMESPDKMILHFPWYMARYMLSQANLVMDLLDLYEWNTQKNEIDNVRAQMLTLRSHAYWRMLQLYGNRWQDSDNGEAYCVPLETKFTAENKPLAKMKDIVSQCYTDLDQAISLFNASGIRHTVLITPDLEVAKAVKLRLALLSEDWATVDKLGSEITNSYPLTSIDELQAGFFKAAPSWVWGASSAWDTPEGYNTSLYYWSFSSLYSCNGTYPAHWVYNNSIDKGLYLSIPEDDIRRSLFAMPDQAFSKPFQLPTWSDWHSDAVDQYDLFYTINGKWINASTSFFKYYRRFTPVGANTSAFSSEPDKANIPVSFGAQVKFYSKNGTYSLVPGEESVVFFRTEEALLSQAEAKYRMGDEPGTRKLLVRLNKTRNPDYTCTLSGEELLAEIQLYRRIELWGEGHSWYDRKRWNLPMERKAWEPGNEKSGNWPYDAAISVAPSELNGWRYMLPKLAVKHNPLIDVSLMDYDDISGYEDTPEAQTASKGERIKPAVTHSNHMVRELQTEPQSNLGFIPINIQ